MFIFDESYRDGEEADLKTRQESRVKEAVRSAIAALQPLTAALLGCVTPAEVVEAVVERGVTVLSARAGLVALVSEDGEHLELVHTSGYSPEVMRDWQRFAISADLPLSDAVRNNEVLLFEGGSDWRARYPDMVASVPRGNFQASASLPLCARENVFGALHFSFPTERSFSAADQEFLADLSRQCALALDRAILLDRAEQSRSQAEAARSQAEAARDAAQAANRRLEFLSRASAMLGESLDYQSRLEELARLCVPEIADWAGVDILDEGGDLRRLAVAHRTPAREETMREVQRRYPPESQRGATTLTVIQTGERLFYTDIPEHLIDQGAADVEHARLLKEVGVKSALSLPLTARGKTLGALSLGMGPEPVGSGRSFSPEIVALAEELAVRAAVLIDNARLFRSVEAGMDALRASEERYRTLFETASVGIVYQDGEAAILDANPAAQRILGLTLDQMKGVTSLDPRWKAVREDGGDFPGNEHPVPRALRTCEVERDLMGIFHPRDEMYRWIDVTAVPHCHEGEDRPHLIYALFEDITERRRAEAARREGEERFRALADNIAQLAWMADASGSIFWYNRRWFEYTGTTLEEMQGWDWRKVHHPDYVEAVTRRFREHVEAGIPWEDTFPIRGADGEYRWFLSRAFPTRDESGAVILWCGTNTDVTEQREAEARQRRLAREMLYSLTEGRMRLAETTDDLPTPLVLQDDAVALSERTLRVLRKQVEAVAERLDFVKERCQDLLTAVGEASMNAVKHAGNGVGSVFADPERGTIQVWVTDEGAGIAPDQIHRALERGWTTGGFGHGWWYILKAVDRVYLLTGPTGTTVVLEMDRAAPEPSWLDISGDF